MHLSLNYILTQTKKKTFTELQILGVGFWILIWKLSIAVILLHELQSKKYYLLLKQHLVKYLKVWTLSPIYHFFSHYKFQNSVSNKKIPLHLVHTIKYSDFVSLPCYSQIYCFNLAKCNVLIMIKELHSEVKTTISEWCLEQREEKENFTVLMY